ncbi:uncharacterized protein LOC134528562 [Bacillus rossius redtenbacheri]|uniref:uncharacterized protein LOC134528562 n=1 Tax=Bacillus rossius redtenbacheri TaxID=93214 RepID=UPI002FDC936B
MSRRQSEESRTQLEEMSRRQSEESRRQSEESRRQLEESRRQLEELTRKLADKIDKVNDRMTEVVQHFASQIHETRNEVRTFNESVKVKFTTVDEQISDINQRLVNTEATCQETAKRTTEEQISQYVRTTENQFAEVRTELNQHKTDTSDEIQIVTHRIAQLESRVQGSSLQRADLPTASSDTTIPLETRATLSSIPVHSNITGNETRGKTVHTVDGQPIVMIDPTSVLNHPSRHWVEDKPTFSAKSHENPRKFLKTFEEYSSHFNLTESEKLKCLSSSLKSTAYYWWEVHHHVISSYEQFKKLFLNQYWSLKLQGNLRAMLHGEKFDPKRNSSLEGHLSDMFERTRYLDVEMDDGEFVAMVLGQLPMRYQLHLSGQNFENISDFREQLLAYERLDRQNRTNNIDREENQRPIYTKPNPVYQPWNQRRNDVRIAKEEIDGRRNPGSNGK